MPSREYFLKDRDSDYVQAYLKYMVNVAVLLGATREFATSEMNAVLEFEIQMANVSSTVLEFCFTLKLSICKLLTTCVQIYQNIYC